MNRVKIRKIVFGEGETGNDPRSDNGPHRRGDCAADGRAESGEAGSGGMAGRLV